MRVLGAPSRDGPNSAGFGLQFVGAGAHEAAPGRVGGSAAPPPSRLNVTTSASSAGMTAASLRPSEDRPRAASRNCSVVESQPRSAT